MAKEFKDVKNVILQNKDIDGGSADNRHRLTIPKNSTSELASLDRKEATIAWDQDQQLVVVDDGSGFSPVGSGGGGAVDSVNGQTGVVVLTATNVGAASQSLGNLSSPVVNTNINMNSHKLTNVTDPTSAQDAATKNYVDNSTGSGATVALDNLDSTAVNVSIIPGADQGPSLGAPGLRFDSTYTNSIQTGSITAQAGDLVVTSQFLTLNSSDSVESQALVFKTADGSAQIAIKSLDSMANPSTSWTLPDGDGTNGQVLTWNTGGELTWESGGSGASTALDNLVTTSINQDLLPDGSFTRNLGSGTNPWTSAYIAAITDANDNPAFLISNGSLRQLFFPTGDQAIDFSTNAAVNLGLAGDTASPIALRLYDQGAAGYAGLVAPTAVSGSYTLTLPSVDGTAGQVLSWNMGGLLTWEDAGGGDFATQALDNLDNVNINTDLLFDSDGNHDIGSAAASLLNIYSYIFRVHNGGSIIFKDLDNSNQIVFNCPDVVPSNYTFYLPPDAGMAGGVLQTNGSFTGWSNSPIQVYTNSSDPGGGAAGMIYYNTGLNKLKMYNGATWETITSV